MTKLELTTRIFREVAIVQERTDFFLKRDLPAQLPATQFALLNHLLYTTNQDETPSDLARNSLVSLSAMSQLIRQLVKKNYVVLETQAEDARRKIIRITEAGRVAHNAALRQVGDHFRPVSTQMTATDLEQLLGLLRRFREAFEQVTATTQPEAGDK